MIYIEQLLRKAGAARPPITPAPADDAFEPQFELEERWVEGEDLEPDISDLGLRHDAFDQREQTTETRVSAGDFAAKAERAVTSPQLSPEPAQAPALRRDEPHVEVRSRPPQAVARTAMPPVVKRTIRYRHGAPVKRLSASDEPLVGAEATSAHREERLVERIEVSPAPVKTMRPEARDATPGEPAVSISIGRIDVRAAVQSQAERKRDGPIPPRLSLDAFLQERNAHYR